MHAIIYKCKTFRVSQLLLQRAFMFTKAPGPLKTVYGTCLFTKWDLSTTIPSLWHMLHSALTKEGREMKYSIPLGSLGNFRVALWPSEMQWVVNYSP